MTFDVMPAHCTTPLKMAPPILVNRLEVLALQLHPKAHAAFDDFQG